MDKKLSHVNGEIERIDTLFKKVVGHIAHARQSIQRTVDTEMVKAYWLIGKEIIEEEQFGKERADYGKNVLKSLSVRLTTQYRRGFSVDTLERARKFYLVYQLEPEQNSAAPLRNLPLPDAATVYLPAFSPNLSWGHYLLLIRLKREDARQFYEIESIKNHWSTRELRRQIDSLLFERLIQSKNKDEILKLAYEGQEVIQPMDAIKDPVILEFLGLPEAHQLIESKLEQALIENMQQFLLELGRGFAFVARQKRLTLEGDHFYADLVMYNIPLKSYVVIDIKTRAITHADLGQIQLYVNYFDQEIKTETDNPTIGLVLCTRKNNSMVKYLLGDQAKKIFASTYQFHLPSEEELEAELERELHEIEQNKMMKQLKNAE